MRPWHRIWQFWQALAAAPPPEPPPDLGPALRELFRQMPRADRAHALRAYRTVLAHEGAPADLATAALLHDAGKGGRGIHLWDRVLFVLAARLAPGWLQQIRRPRLALWAGLVALHEHAEQGARLAAAAGCSPLAVDLIRFHHSDPAALRWPPARRSLLEALQRADEES